MLASLLAPTRCSYIALPHFSSTRCTLSSYAHHQQRALISHDDQRFARCRDQRQCSRFCPRPCRSAAVDEAAHSTQPPSDVTADDLAGARATAAQPTAESSDDESHDFTYTTANPFWDTLSSEVKLLEAWLVHYGTPRFCSPKLTTDHDLDLFW